MEAARLVGANEFEVIGTPVGALPKKLALGAERRQECLRHGAEIHTGRCVLLYSPTLACYAFFPYRQSLAPGGWALNENLPNVCSFCLLRTEASPQRTSSRGKKMSSLFVRTAMSLGATYGYSSAEAFGWAVGVHDKRGHLA